VESGEALWQQSGASSVGEEAEVTDADEALGGAGEVGSDAETHRARGSSVSADCGRQSHASER
jgi:hypothetical protein